SRCQSRRQQPTPNSRAFRSVSLPRSRKNASIGRGSVAVSQSGSVMASPLRVLRSPASVVRPPLVPSPGPGRCPPPRSVPDPDLAAQLFKSGDGSLPPGVGLGREGGQENHKG